jgi:hypothetical protein
MKFSTILVGLSTVFLADCIILDCSFDSLIVPTLGGSYHCDAKVKPGASNLIEQVNGQHLPNKTTSDVTSIWVRYQPVAEIPKNFLTFFPKIKAIYLLGTNLRPVTAYDLKPFPDLIYFGSASNQPQVNIASDLFQFNPKLRGVNFYNASLQHVGFGALKILKDLEQAGLQKNPCIDKFFSKPAEIDKLKETISTSCPPLEGTTTVKPAECNLRCSLDDEVDDLTMTILEQNEKITRLETKIAKIELQLRRT